MRIEVTAPVPRSVGRLQARLALYDAGLLPAVEALIAQSDERTQMAWDEATELYRASPTVVAIAQAMEWSDEFVDALFVAAAGINP